MSKDEFHSSTIEHAETNLGTRIDSGLTEKESTKRNVVSR